MKQQIFAIAARLYRGEKPVRSSHYIAWVRSFPCLACYTRRRIEAAHIGPHGIGQKASDLQTVPLCFRCHRHLLHRLGRVQFEMLEGLDLGAAILDLQDLYAKRFGRLPGEREKAA